MTGYGRSELRSKHGRIRVEVKTTNHKFFEISSKLSPHLTEFEESIRKTVSQEIRRGKVYLFVSSPDPASFSSRLVLNEELALEVLHKVKRLRQVLGLKKAKDPAREEDFLLREVLHYPEVLTKDVSANQETLFFRDLQKAVAGALKKLRDSRVFEGNALVRDFKRRLEEMKRSLRGVEKRLPVLGREFKASLETKMKEFTKNGALDTERITQEVALYLKNSDISEEVTRLKSHIDAMMKTLKESGEIGRKIDFIAQEMYRETNTMGAKSSDVAIANHVIQLKSAIEKIREQAQNVE